MLGWIASYRSTVCILRERIEWIIPLQPEIMAGQPDSQSTSTGIVTLATWAIPSGLVATLDCDASPILGHIF